MTSEVTIENIFDIMSDLYNQMLGEISDPAVEQIQMNVELMKRDSSENNLKICLDELEGIYEQLHRKYPDDDLVNLLQVRIIECRSVFGILDESDIDE